MTMPKKYAIQPRSHSGPKGRNSDRGSARPQPSGALLRSGSALDRGAEVQVHLQLPGEELPIPAAGAVVRRTDNGLLGVRLDRMRDADRELVDRWIRGQRR